ncbi:MAG: hypothetical protein H6668_15515 [Ardenticatenaceae bacterium]|nr:hypothetical protein [Ardenticatenaceae bacterium]
MSKTFIPKAVRQAEAEAAKHRLKRDLSTHECQVALVQVLERPLGFARQGKPVLSSGWNTKNENRTQIFLIKPIRKIR